MQKRHDKPMSGGVAMFLWSMYKMCSTMVRWLALVWNVAVAYRQHVPAQAQPSSHDQTKKCQTEQLTQPNHFSFSPVISVTFEPVAADSSCHTREEVNT